MAGQIVVGIDGSGGGAVALAFAFDEALRRDADLLGIYAWSFPILAATPAPFGGVPVPPVDDMATAAKEGLETILEGVTVPAGVRFHSEVREGSPSRVLIAASETADLVIVGSRGHGGFTGLLLGSVSQQVVSHSKCPVVVVPDNS